MKPDRAAAPPISVLLSILPSIVLSTLLVGGGGCRRSEPTPPAVAPATTGSAAGSASGSAGGSAAASTGDPWQQPAKAKDPLARPLFWTAQKDGKTTYLLGTIHIGVDAESRLPKRVWDALDAAPVFAMETDTSNPNASSMVRTQGSLRQDLGEVYWAKLEKALGAEEAKQLNQMKPMVAGTLLAMRGLPSTPPMDGVLLGRALNQGKQIVYLEPVAVQISILEKHMTVRAVKMLIDDADKGFAQSRQLLEAYQSGDEQAIAALTEQQRKDALAHGYTEAEYAEQMQDLLYARNASWIAPLEKLHATGNGFVAVGAMHLIGPKSVLELLAAKGYTISRVAP